MRKPKRRVTFRHNHFKAALFNAHLFEDTASSESISQSYGEFAFAEIAL